MESILHNLHDPAVIRDPYPIYRKMREEEPMWLNPVSGSFTLSRYCDISRVLKASQFSNTRVETLFARLPEENPQTNHTLRTFLEDRLVFTEGGQHQRIKSLMAESFSHRHLTNYEGLIQDQLDRLLDSIHPGTPVDMIEQVIQYFPGLIILSILGVPINEQEDMKAWTDTIYAWMGHFPGNIEDRTLRANDAFQSLQERLKFHIAKVRTHPGNDMLSSLVHAEESGRFLNESELIANVIGLINAGQETTVCLLANGLYRLLQNQDQLKLLRAQPELIDTAIDEMLRFDAPAQFVARQVIEPVEINGIMLDSGTLVALGLGSANRDESAFENPDCFDIRRSPNRHLSFGNGRHYCVGSGLALLEARIFFKSLIGRFTRIQADWQRDDIEWRPTLTFRSPQSLPVTLG
jgi:pimeloyl-[acyl-carrier protein] synthase